MLARRGFSKTRKGQHREPRRNPSGTRRKAEHAGLLSRRRPPRRRGRVRRPPHAGSRPRLAARSQARRARAADTPGAGRSAEAGPRAGSAHENAQGLARKNLAAIPPTLLTRRRRRAKAHQNAERPAEGIPLRAFTARAAREAAASPERKQARKGTIPLRAFTARAAHSAPLLARGTARKKKSALRERDALPSRSLALQYSRRRRA